MLDTMGSAVYALLYLILLTNLNSRCPYYLIVQIRKMGHKSYSWWWPSQDSNPIGVALKSVLLTLSYGNF